MVAKSAAKSRATTPEYSLRSRSRTSDRSAKSQVFGSPPPTPSRIYGRKSKARSYMNTPSRLRGPSAASTSSTPLHYRRSLADPMPSYTMQSLALDYELPVLPETPSDSSASSSFDLTSIASSSPSTNSSDSNRVEESGLDVDSDSDDEPVFISRIMPIQSSAFRDSDIMDELRQVRLDLENAREGCFTPIPNYFIQSHLDNMLRLEGIPTPSRQPLQWPLKFQSGPTPLPFPPSAATFPV
ncbi:uncharacterized protein C8R40DRAFT_1164958 [Lentinula edodes]|uniref:uncharacterized protein n=1 Tax=Lentinula edodes TaxID=5353 RepID=UPI001E8E71EC|nr:uncharacterized protein C8R40DRAFT_1164958 [Lentinula edodes]KAH7881544.1 hypothetical protein C8R40DRAFT_1164958 [Lentinula edodes]